MDLYEYQGKELFRRYGIPVSDGRLATSPEEARAAAQELGGQVVVKAQVLTGGRGKAGGIKLADTPDEAEEHARNILGMDINGHVVRKLWIESASDIAREYYLSLTFDRGEKRALFMFTKEGGIDIEEVAAERPEALARLHVNPLEGFQPYQARRLIYGAGIEDEGEQKQIAKIAEKLYDAFVGTDAMLTEINPLIVTPDGQVKALDSKFTVDDNALYKHPDIAEMRDLDAYPPEERAAREKDVTYVKLDGEVGVLGNGAGLVMSTLDVVALAGGRPANFCDLGGGGDAQGVVDALEVITADPQVKSILFNIFGGITRCDEVARGILQALGQLTIEDPIVVRLDGTNAEEGTTAAAGRRAAEPACRADDARGGEARSGAGRMSWSERAQLYRESRGASRGRRPRPRRRVGGGRRHGARRGDRRRACRAAPARGRDQRRHYRSRAGHAAGRPLPRGRHPVRGRQLRRRRLPRGCASLRRRRQGDDGDGAREPRPGDRRRQRLPRRVRGGGRPRSRPVARPELHGGRVAPPLRGSGLRVEELRHLDKPIEVEPWLERAGCHGEEAQRVRELLGDRIEDGWITLDRLAIRGRVSKCPSRRYMPASGPRSRGARAHPPPHQGLQTLARRSANSGLVLATQRLGSIT